MGYRIALAGCVILIMPTAGTAQALADRLSRARALLVATEIEEAVDSLRAMRLAAGDSTSHPTFANVHLELAAAELSLGLRDSAMARASALIAVDPFFVLERGRFNPELEAVLDTARTLTPAVALRTPTDSVIRPGQDRYPIEVGIAMPGTVGFEFRGDSGSAMTPPTPITTSTTLGASLLRGEGVGLETGTYTLIATFTGPGGETRSAATVVSVARLPVDTTTHLPPVDSTTLLPETRKGGIVFTSIIQGVLVGAAAAAVPALVFSPELEEASPTPESIGVGVGIGVASVLGSVIGRPDVTIEENVQENQRRIDQRAQENIEIAQQNEAMRQLAPLRITRRNP